MHPLFHDRRRLIAYLTLAAPVTAAIAGVLGRGPQGFPPAAAWGLGFLLAVAALFLVLPVWYVCRAFPIASSPLSRLALAHVTGGAMMGGAWLYAGGRATHWLAF